MQRKKKKQSKVNKKAKKTKRKSAESPVNKRMIMGHLETLEEPTLLRRIRAKKGMTQAELAKKIGLNNSVSYSQIEAGKVTASDELAKKIAKALRVPVKTVFDTVVRKEERFVAIS